MKYASPVPAFDGALHEPAVSENPEDPVFLVRPFPGQGQPLEGTWKQIRARTEDLAAARFAVDRYKAEGSQGVRRIRVYAAATNPKVLHANGRPTVATLYNIEMGSPRPADLVDTNQQQESGS